MTGDQLDIFGALAEAVDNELARLSGGPADVIPSRTTDPETSHAAAAEIKVKARTQRAYLLQAFAEERMDGLTDEQAMFGAYGVSMASEYAKRCSELREGGFIEPTGETRAGSAGPQRIVSRITAKGHAWIEQNR